MVAYYTAAALLWLLLVVLACVLLVALAPGTGLSLLERAGTAAAVLLLGTPLALQVAGLQAAIREVRANFLVIGPNGLRLRLSGRQRASKGLPAVPETELPRSEITGVTRERRQFLFPSVVPFRYPLDVYTIETRGGLISFTRECLAGAGRTARQVAARLAKPAGRVS